MEASRSFENHSRKVETAESRFRAELRDQVFRSLEHSHDPLTIEIGNKILEKIEIKDRIDDIQSGKDDPSSYQKWKQLGLFIVIDRKSRISWKDKSGLEIQEGDSILDIHLPPVREAQRNLANITGSMRLLAQYIVQQDLHPKYIVGVTFEKLARVSRRQGFTVVEPEIPDDIQRGVENVYRRFEDAGVNDKELGRILLCYQETDQFVKRYLR